MKPVTSRFFLLVGLAIIGFLDSGYLTYKHFSGQPAACGIIEGCDKVLASAYATIGSVPVALVGFGYYAFLLYLFLAYYRYRNENLLKTAAAVAALGFLVSLWFVYLQLFVIKAICFYCLISAAVSTLLAFFTIISLLKG